MLDPETIDGDYKESYQRWHHLFQKALKEGDFVPFEFKYNPDTLTSVQDRIKQLNSILRNSLTNDEQL